MHCDSSISRGALIDLRIGLFLNRRNHHLAALGARRIQEQKREAPIAGNQAEFARGSHSYLITPR
jgi:hypothetical protein